MAKATTKPSEEKEKAKATTKPSEEKEKAKATTKPSEEKTEEKVDIVAEIQKVNEVLIECSDAMTVVLRKVDGSDRYVFENRSQEAAKARKKIREILRNVYQNGVFNYDELAKKLRVQSLDIFGSIDDQFIEEKGLME